MVRTGVRGVCATTAVIAMLAAPVSLGAGADDTGKVFRNVIIMIPDGTSQGGVTLARWLKGAPLALDPLAVGLVRTYSIDAPIADSAPSGSSYANGHKSHTGFVGVTTDPAFGFMPGQQLVGEARRPVASIMEAARLAGMSTGIVATAEIMHATPAAFSAHFPDREHYGALSEQQVHNSLDVVFGGGYACFTREGRTNGVGCSPNPKKPKAGLKDRDDLLATLRADGYAVVRTPAEMAAVARGKVWGLFADSAMSYDRDRDPARQPSLAEMTAKAIELLSQNPRGFVLMVEGSKIDWAAHANDPVGMVSDILAFDRAVETAVGFARRDGTTLVLAMADHGNSGITIGDASTTKSYDDERLETFLAPFQRAKLTGEGLEARLRAGGAPVARIVEDWYGIDDLSKEELASITAALADPDKVDRINNVVGPMVAGRAKIGFTTGGHTGEDVALYLYAPPGYPRLGGVVENDAVGRFAAEAAGLDLAATNARLFINAEAAFTRQGSKVSVDASDPENLVLVVTNGTTTARFRQNERVATVNGKPVRLEGVTVFNGPAPKAGEAPKGVWYVGEKALELVR